jgi:molybdopterin-binding protein
VACAAIALVLAACGSSSSSTPSSGGSRTSAHRGKALDHGRGAPAAVDELKLDDGGELWASVNPDAITVYPAMITKEEHVMKLSARNQIPARVTRINSGEAIANVELDANGVRLVASITVEAVRDLGLTEGTNVFAIIKASEVILATGD